MLNKHVADDGFHSESVKFAEFDTMFEIPVIEPNKKIVIPDSLVPYSKIKYADKKKLQSVFTNMIAFLRMRQTIPNLSAVRFPDFRLFSLRTVLCTGICRYVSSCSTFIGTEEPDAAGSRKECMSFRISGGETKEHMRLAF